jgi:hypothetical protein
MKATLEEIHRDPAIIDRAIERQESVDVVSEGQVKGTFKPLIAENSAPLRKMGKLPDFAARRAKWGIKPMTPEQREEFFRFLRGE